MQKTMKGLADILVGTDGALTLNSQAGVVWLNHNVETAENQWSHEPGGVCRVFLPEALAPPIIAAMRAAPNLIVVDQGE